MSKASQERADLKKHAVATYDVMYDRFIEPLKIKGEGCADWLNFLLSFTVQGMLGQAYLGTATLEKIGNNLGIVHPRSLGEAVRGHHYSRTDYDLYTWRVYQRTFGDDFVVRDNFRDLGFAQTRILNTYVGDQQWEHEERAGILKSLYQANRVMKEQMKGSFLKIDDRTYARRKMDRKIRTFEEMPVESLTVTWEAMRDPELAVHRGIGITSEWELAFDWLVSGERILTMTHLPSGNEWSYSPVAFGIIQEFDQLPYLIEAAEKLYGVAR